MLKLIKTVLWHFISYNLARYDQDATTQQQNRKYVDAHAFRWLAYPSHFSDIFTQRFSEIHSNEPRDVSEDKIHYFV